MTQQAIIQRLAGTLIAVGFYALAVSTHAQDKSIVKTTDSPYVKLKSINIGDARWTEGFWADKFKLAESTIVPHMGTLLTGDIGHGLNNLKIAAGLKKGKHKGFAWHDGDFYKWLESTIYLYAINKDEQLMDDLDTYIAIIKKAQQPNGYLSSFNTIKGLGQFVKRGHHELYNSGHLITTAVIHHRITGKRDFLDIAIKHADYLHQLFSPKPKHLARFGFNQTQIMALVELYRETKEKKYLKLAELFINMRGKAKSVAFPEDQTVRPNSIGDMTQERTPFRQEKEAVGHAVLAMYYYAGAADVYSETGEQALLDALKRLWSSSNEKKMYITGALGQTHHGVSKRQDMIHEGFLDDYVMPNSTAYNETCANISNAMFNWRMLGILGESKFADNMELVMYNSALSGISASGTHYYYTNPLRKAHGVLDYKKMTTEFDERQSYLKCFCCPPNLARTVAKLSGWAYSLSRNGLAVNLYGGNQLDTHLLDGTRLQLSQTTQYPWDGNVTFSIEQAKKEAFDFLIRIPEWAIGSTIKVNGKAVDETITAGKFATINRQWKKGDVLELNMPMTTNFIEGHPHIEAVRNQIALKRGPVVYAIESPDLPEGASIFDVYVSPETTFKVNYRPDFLGGLATLEGKILLRQDQSNGMYRRVDKPQFKAYETSFVPYYAWSNRGKSEMSVFLPAVW